MSLIQRLQRTSLAGAIMEYPQTSQNLSIMTEELFRLITSRNLLAYDDKELQSHVLNAVTVESSRGIRLSKEKASRKIDLAISLAMACAAALQVGKPLASYAVPIGVGKVTNPFSDSRPRGETEIPRTRIPCPIGVGHSGWSLHSRDDDDDYYVGAKPVR